MGTLLGIAIRDASRAPMQVVQEVVITPDDGLHGDYRGSVAHRQVTVLVRESWEAACAQLGVDLPWTLRRANLLIEGFPLADSAETHLRIGSVVLEVTGETVPCSRMEEAYPGLQNALAPSWRGGVTCRVVAGGAVKVGDPVLAEQVEPSR